MTVVMKTITLFLNPDITLYTAYLRPHFHKKNPNVCFQEISKHCSSCFNNFRASSPIKWRTFSFFFFKTDWELNIICSKSHKIEFPTEEPVLIIRTLQKATNWQAQGNYLSSKSHFSIRRYSCPWYDNKIKSFFFLFPKFLFSTRKVRLSDAFQCGGLISRKQKNTLFCDFLNPCMRNGQVSKPTTFRDICHKR